MTRRGFAEIHAITLIKLWRPGVNNRASTYVIEVELKFVLS